ncbi:MAG: hypothetical protein ACK48U_21800, partial [Planctomyces sp.]
LTMVCPPLRVFAASREELRFSEHGRSQRGWSGGISGAVSPVPPPLRVFAASREVSRFYEHWICQCAWWGVKG